jgi:hypothetical protein
MACLLSPELAAGLSRVKGVHRLGLRVGNWLTAEQGESLLDAACAIRTAASAKKGCLRLSSATRFSTVDAICEALSCQPATFLRFEPEEVERKRSR